MRVVRTRDCRLQRHNRQAEQNEKAACVEISCFCCVRETSSQVAQGVGFIKPKINSVGQLPVLQLKLFVNLGMVAFSSFY